MKLTITLGLALFLFASLGSAQEKLSPRGGTRAEAPQLLSFDDLIALSSMAKVDGQLAARLDTLLTTPFVNNDASDAGIQPHRPTVANVGPVPRVGLWNIERGLNFELIRSALTDTGEFHRLQRNQSQNPDVRKTVVQAQLMALQNVDVMILNEVDLGMKRTGYRDVARDLAAALQMNYAYGVEFVEVDPVFELGIEQVHLQDVQQDLRLHLICKWTEIVTAVFTAPPS
jgi:hypothetical protein